MVECFLIGSANTENATEVLTMPNYIDREKAREIVCDFCRWAGTSNCEECEHPVDDVPDADVRPVVRGKWKHDGSDWKNRFICDQCGYKWFFEAEEAHFCSNCGCAMGNEK